MSFLFMKCYTKSRCHPHGLVAKFQIGTIADKNDTLAAALSSIIQIFKSRRPYKPNYFNNKYV